jgi:hypothetical protein
VAYTPLALPVDLEPAVAGLVCAHVEPFFHDVRSMLRLPIPSEGLVAACNWTLTEILCSVISGVSRVFQAPSAKTGDLFGQILSYYPDESALPRALPTSDVQAELYETFRCNLAHSLGLSVDRVGNPTPLARRTSVARGTEGLDDARIGLLEQPARPSWLPPTLELNDGILRLYPEALYYGTRCLVIAVCSDSARVADASRFIAWARSGDETKGVTSASDALRRSLAMSARPLGG